MALLQKSKHFCYSSICLKWEKQLTSYGWFFTIILKIQISKMYSINFPQSNRNHFFSSQLNHAYCIPTYNNFLAANLENYFSKVPTIVLSMAQLPTYLPALSAKVRKEKRNLIWSIGKRIIGLSWQTTDLFQQHVNGITTLLLCKDCLR